MCLRAKSLFLRKIGRLGTSLDTLPMSGGQGLTSFISRDMGFPESVEVGHSSRALGNDRSASGNRSGGVRVSVDNESGYGQADYKAGSQAGGIPGVLAPLRMLLPRLRAMLGSSAKVAVERCGIGDRRSTFTFLIPSVDVQYVRRPLRHREQSRVGIENLSTERKSDGAASRAGRTSKASS
jgi:hypothetical protein